MVNCVSCFICIWKYIIDDANDNDNVDDDEYNNYEYNNEDDDTSATCMYLQCDVNESTTLNECQKQKPEQ